MKEEVKDKFGIVYFIFVLLGATTLLPFNVFMTEKEFYDVRLHAEPFDPYMASNFMGLFGLIYNTLNLISLGLLIRYQRLLSLRVLVLQPMVVAFIVLASTAVLALRVDLSGELVARFTMPSLGLMGACAALLAGGTLQLASIFSPVHIQAVVSGIAIGGVLTSSLSFFAQLSEEAAQGAPTPEDVAPVAFKYFTASSVLVALAIIGYSALPFLPYGRYKLLLAGIIDDPKERKMLTTDEDYEEPLLTVVEGAGAGTSSGTRTESVTRAAIISVETDFTQGSRSWQFRHAFSIYCITLFVCMATSIAFHPGISSFVCSVHNPATVSPCAPRTEYGRLAGDLFVPLLYVLFSVGDYLGRNLSIYGPWGRGPPKPVSILIYSIIRAVLSLGILFCHVVSPHQWLLPTALDNDVAPLAIILGLGLTQGHLIATLCMHAPGTLLPTQQSLFGPVTSFAISLGAFIGSFVNISLATRFQAAP